MSSSDIFRFIYDSFSLIYIMRFNDRNLRLVARSNPSVAPQWLRPSSPGVEVQRSIPFIVFHVGSSLWF